jgi:hypothetical protein
MRSFCFFLLSTLPFWATAQQAFNIQLPDAVITAERVVRGDADTYGLGDWQCSFKADLEGTAVILTGKIVFTEKANDYTTIVGTFKQRVAVGELERCRHCRIELEDAFGTVSGPNTGARGYQWFYGQGIIQKARIQTDTFGIDAGYIGGTVTFLPIRVVVHCAIAAVE